MYVQVAISQGSKEEKGKKKTGLPSLNKLIEVLTSQAESDGLSTSPIASPVVSLTSDGRAFGAYLGIHTQSNHANKFLSSLVNSAQDDRSFLHDTPKSKRCVLSI